MKLKIVLIAALSCAFFAMPAMAVDFIDARGRSVSVENPQSVVSLYNSYGDAWLLAGGELTGTIEPPSGIGGMPGYAGAQDLGSHTSPNMELLFSLEPDFVLLSSSVPSHEEIGATLEEAGVTCAYFNTPNWQSYMESMRVFTQITGREDLYEAQEKAVQQPIQALMDEAAADEGHYNRTTALLLRASSTSVKAKDSESTVAGNILRDMGFVNIADGGGPLSENLSMESILIADPDYIFLVVGSADTEAAMNALSAALTDNPAWSTLTAVRENRFIVLDRELFHYHPNERWAESYDFIADLIREDDF
jgi:ABC-type Fe3+-hydroxamate transport system substrate-binding protein